MGQQNAKGSEGVEATESASGKNAEEGSKKGKAKVWGSLMRRKGSVVALDEGAGRRSGVAVVNGSDRGRREEMAILLAGGWIGVGGRYGNAAGRRNGFDAGRAWPR